MPSAASDEAVIGAVYEAALAADDPSTLPAMLSGVVGSSSVVLFVADAAHGLDVAAHNIPQAAIETALLHYFHINPFSPVAAAVPPMTAMRGEDLLPISRYRRTEFYADFAAPLDSVEVIGARMLIAPGVKAEICLHRGARMKAYTSHEVTRVQRLLPHLQRALQLRRRLPPAHHGIGLAALDIAADPAIILAPNGLALFANRAASRLAAAGRLALGGGVFGLTLPQTADQARLAALVRDAVAGGPGGSMAATAGDGGRLFLLVAPLPLRFGVSPGHVLVMLRQPSVGPQVDAANLRAMFGLTGAEARLAQALAGGATIPALTGSWGLSENTLRSQLSAIFGKTGCASQRDLAALLATIPRRFAADDRAD